MNRKLIGTFALSLFLPSLVSCTKVNPEFSFLSETFGSLYQKGDTPSPFDQDIESQKYIIFGGECPQNVKSFEFKFNDTNWNPVALLEPTPGNGEAAPTITVNINQANVQYDTDCSDGTFKFWMYASEIMNILGQQGLDKDDIQKISLRGIGLIPTEPIVFLNKNHEGPPVRFMLGRDEFDEQVAEMETCQFFTASLLNSENKWTSARETTNFIFQSSSDQSNWSNLVIFENQNDCFSSANQKTSLYFNNNEGWKSFWYKRDHATYTSGDVAHFRLADGGNSSALSASFSKEIRMRKTADMSNRYVRWDGPRMMIVDHCYPFKMQSRGFGYGNDYISSAAEFNVFVVGGGIYPKTYSNYSDCQNDVNGSDMFSSNIQVTYASGYTSTETRYIRMPASYAGTSKVMNLNILSSGYSVDSNSVTFDLRNEDSSYRKLEVRMQNQIPTSTCIPVQLELKNQNFIAVTKNSDTSINLPLNASWYFYSSQMSCSYGSGAITNVVISAGSYKSLIYMKISTPNLSSEKLEFIDANDNSIKASTSFSSYSN